MQRESIRDTLFYADKWNIGFVEQSAGDFISRKALKPVTWLQEELSDYSADPFVVSINNELHVFYEFLDFWEGRGKICRITGLNFSSRQLVTGFTPSGIHLSYPYTFSDGGVVYCIPETAEANEVVLYEIDQAQPSQVIRRRILLTGAPYLDSSIVLYNGKYWLFTCNKLRSREVLIFHAASLTDQFEPHAMNPVRCDQRSFRSAGHLFMVDGTLYRPTQNLQHSYGGAIIINRIKVLTENNFESEFLFEVMPEAPYTAGMHNISFSGNLIVVDGKRKIGSPFMLIKKLNVKIKYYLRKFYLSARHRHAIL